MAIPLDNRQINNVVTTTLDAKKPRLIDLFFNSNPLFVRLRSRHQVKWRGGDKIAVPFIYAGLGGGSYGKGDTFDTSQTEFLTELLLDWRRNYAPMNLDTLDAAKNSGVARIVSLVDALLQTARMTMADNIGSQIFTDGNGNGGKDIDGLKIAIATDGTYGGIARAATGPGNQTKAGGVNTTGGAFSQSMVQTQFGNATIANEKPDLIITTQTIWNKWWERVDARQRTGAEDLKKVGMDSFEFNGADVVVDSHCPSGEIYLLNTNYIEYWIMEGYDFSRRGPFDLHNQDATVDQLIQYSNLVVTAPRLQARIESVT